MKDFRGDTVEYGSRLWPRHRRKPEIVCLGMRHGTSQAVFEYMGGRIFLLNQIELKAARWRVIGGI